MFRFLCRSYMLFVSLAVFADEAPLLRATMRDGTTIEQHADLSPDVDVIVEFTDPPLAVRRAERSTYEANFARLRRDVATIEQRAMQTKTALEPIVHRRYFEAFHGMAMRVPRAALAQIGALPYVKRVHRDAPMQAFSDPNMEAIGAARTWSISGTRGAGVTVAIIDTGIDYMHPALGGGFGPGHKVAGGWDFVNDDDDPFDDQGHGTHVAGIVAANLDSVTGVAPDATLIAYKVLDAAGHGAESNVIAALDWAIDPNGDGDLSDHVSVANLSLGGDGNPDDAISIAVDNAVAAGVVVCVAAGNSGMFHAVSSPGTARNAITVGAVDNSDVLASFSAKGPAAKLAAIKPDVMAPGMSIRSTYLGGGYVSLSGTSMATPHVAGAAALIRAVHPDWSPAAVKSALMLYAKGIAYELLTQGSGRIDVARAAQATVLAEPASISFGLDALTSGTFLQARPIRITNRGVNRESVALSVDGSRRGVTVGIAPAKFELGPGESIDAMITLSVKNDDTAPSVTESFAYSGLVHLDTATTQLHMPWAVVKAARATVRTDMRITGELWLGDARVPSPVTIEDQLTETLLPPGDYDLVVSGVDVPEGSFLPSAQALVILEKQAIRGDVAITANRSLAANAVTFDGVDAKGARLARPLSPRVWYGTRARLLASSSSYLKTLDLPAINNLYVSDLSSRWSLAASEALFDFDNARYTYVGHQPVSGIDHDVDLKNAAADLLNAPVKIVFPPDGANRSVTIATFAGVTGINTTARDWSANLYMTRAADGDSTAEFGLFSGTREAMEMSIPSMIARGNRIEIGSAYSAADAEPLVFGVGPLYPRLPMTINASQFNPRVGFAGQLGDYRVMYDYAGLITVKGTSGVVYSGPALRTPITLPPDAYTIDYSAVALSLGDRLARAEVSASVDTTLGSASAPVLTSMYVADAGGRAMSSFAPRATASLRFAAVTTSAKAWFRDSGTAKWTELPISIDGDNRFHADLAPATKVPGAVELRIELTDAKGNRITYALEPAFTVGDVPLLPRRRP